MATKKLSVRLVAENGRQVRAELEGVGNAGAESFKRLSREVDVAGVLIRRLAGIAAGAFSVRQIVAYADTWSDLNSRVVLATGSQEQGAQVMDRLADIARRTYSSLEQTTEGWLSNATALREMGLSTAESLDFTEALNNAMVVSGAKAERATRVQDALAKGMALGALSGNNLNSVIRQGGRVAELLAEDLGTTVAGLRLMGAQGQITGDVIRRALVGNLELLRQEADSMPATIGDAFILIGNAALRLVGTWDKLIGSSSLVAKVLIMVADNLERVASYALAFAGFMATRWVAAFVAAKVATMATAGALTVLTGAIVRTGFGALVVLAGEVVFLFMRLVEGAGGLGEAFRLLGDVAKATWEGIVTTVGSLVDEFRAIKADISGIWTGLMAYLAQKWADFLGTIAPTYNAVAEQLGVSELDVFGAMAQASYLENAAHNMGIIAARHRKSASATRAGAWDGLSEAVAALGAAMAQAGEEGEGSLDDLTDRIDEVTAAMDNAGRAGGGAGQAIAEAAEEAAAGWAKVGETLSDYADKARDISGDIGNALVSAFRGAEDAIGEFVKTGKLKFSELVTSLIADLARLGARKFLLGPLAGMLSGALGGGGGILAGILHGGGMVGGPGPARMVPAMAFAGAPRMHSGGMAGLRSDEVPAILQRGERVLSRREVAAGGAGGVTIHIHARDAESFRQSRAQIAADIARAVSFGRRGM